MTISVVKNLSANAGTGGNKKAKTSSKISKRVTRSMDKSRNTLVTEFLPVKKRTCYTPNVKPSGVEVVEKLDDAKRIVRTDSALSLSHASCETESRCQSLKEFGEVEESPLAQRRMSIPLAAGSEIKELSESQEPLISRDSSSKGHEIIRIKAHVPDCLKADSTTCTLKARTPKQASKLPRVSPTKAPRVIFSPFVQLPTAFQILAKVFDALEYAVFFCHGKGQSAIYHRLKGTVESISGHTFAIRQLAQIMHVNPGLYHVRPVRVSINASRVYTYSIEPKLDIDGTIVAANAAKRFAERIAHRKVDFRQRLADLVGQHYMAYAKSHAQVLEVLKTPSKLSPNSALLLRDVEHSNVHMVRSWHVEFPLNDKSVVPPIEEFKLPQLGDRLEMSKKISSVLTISKTQAPPAVPAPVNKAILPSLEEDKPKSRAAALLERIRERERLQSLSNAALRTDPGAIKFRAMLGRLPEVARSLQYYFSSAKRHAVFLPELTRHIANSNRSGLSENEAIVHIQLLASAYFKFLLLKDISMNKENNEGPLVLAASSSPLSSMPTRFDMQPMGKLPRSHIVVSINKDPENSVEVDASTAIDQLPSTTSLTALRLRCQLLLQLVSGSK